jgi:acyl dehydratase
MGSSPPSDGARHAIAGLQRGWWLEDAVPGAVIDHPGGRTIDEAEHVWLAWVFDNASDVHGNADRAARGEFGRPVVLGALTVAIVLGLAAPATGRPADPASTALPAWRSIRLGRPVVPGDTVLARSSVHEVRDGMVRRSVEGRNQRGEVVATIEEEILAPARGSADRLRQPAGSSPRR